MATTNKLLEQWYSARAPHTLNAMHHLTMAMVRFQKDRDKKTWLGRDKGVAALDNLEGKIRNVLLAMVLDGMLERTSDAARCHFVMLGELEKIAEIYPNWQDAYALVVS